MKADIYGKDTARDLHIDALEKVVCTINGVEVDIRQSTDGKCLIIAVREGKVSMEPRAAAIWLVVKGE